ncbi:MAG TPA: oligosaccharide flippase family protein [Hyphomicrobiales bacterium]|nr:oligosaccharide flippase family protein [Hyphomicrobiales bacterium]
MALAVKAPTLPRLGASFTVLTAARLVGAAIGFATQVLLARTLPQGDLGLFYLATSVAVIAGILGCLGFPAVLMRFQVRYRGRAVADLTGALLKTSRRAGGLVALALAVLVAAYALFWPGLSPNLRLGLVIGAAAAPPIAITRVVGAFAAGFRLFKLNLVPDLLVRPFLFLLFVLAVSTLRPPLTLPLALGAFVALLYAQWLLQAVLLRRLLPDLAAPRPLRTGVARAWVGAALPLVAVILFAEFFADLAIMLAGLFAPPQELAAFAVAIKIAMLAGFAIQVGYQIAFPDLAEAHRARDGRALMRAARLSNVIGLGSALGATLVLIVAGDRVLGVFGPAFARWDGVLVLLMFGQILRALGGPNVQMLTLGGHQKALAWACAVSALTLIVLDAVLMPRFGALGAVAAVLGANAVWTALLAWLLRTRMGIRVDFFAFDAALPRLRPSPSA